jgi:hypothetical protein
MCAEMAPIEKEGKIFEKVLILKYTLKTGVFSGFFPLFCLPLKMLILKYTFKTGVLSRFFLLFSLPLKIGVFSLKSSCVH